ncbi:hypothetical protein Ndes2437B_g05950 [Nannochloris sp. 'desiccata']
MADEEEQDVGPKTRTGAEQAAALDRVTDREDDKEMRAADTSKISQAMAALAAQQHASLEAQRQRDRELAAVKVAQEDIELLVAEFELDKRRQSGNLERIKETPS